MIKAQQEPHVKHTNDNKKRQFYTISSNFRCNKKHVAQSTMSQLLRFLKWKLVQEFVLTSFSHIRNKSCMQSGARQDIHLQHPLQPIARNVRDTSNTLWNSLPNTPSNTILFALSQKTCQVKKKFYITSNIKKTRWKTFKRWQKTSENEHR